MEVLAHVVAMTLGFKVHAKEVLMGVEKRRLKYGQIFILFIFGHILGRIFLGAKI